MVRRRLEGTGGRGRGLSRLPSILGASRVNRPRPNGFARTRVKRQRRRGDVKSPLRALGGEELLFAGEAPAVAGERAVLANDAVAWHDDGDRVGGAGASDGANGFGLAERAGDLRVGARAAARDALQLSPNTTLECGGLQIERKLDVRRAALDALENFRDPALELVGSSGNFRARIFIAQFGDEFVFVVAKIDRGDAAVGGGNEDFSERRLGDGVAELHARASLAIRGGRHAELRVAAFVDAAGRAVTCFVKGVGNA